MLCVFMGSQRFARRTWLRCASGTAQSEPRTWIGWWAWAAPGGHRNAAFQSDFLKTKCHSYVGLLILWPMDVVFACSGSAGRVMLSKEDKEAAKMGLSVFTVRWVDVRSSKIHGRLGRKRLLFPKFSLKGRKSFYPVCVTQSTGQVHALALCFSLPRAPAPEGVQQS